MSRATSGSAFSLIVRPAVVCGTYTWQVPLCTPLFSTTSATLPVISTNWFLEPVDTSICVHFILHASVVRLSMARSIPGDAARAMVPRGGLSVITVIPEGGRRASPGDRAARYGTIPRRDYPANGRARAGGRYRRRPPFLLSRTPRANGGQWSLPLPASSSCRSTASRLNAAGFWRGGNRTNPSISPVTSACMP